MTTLLAVCGLAPQVITETVYALVDQGRAPDRIRVLTTRQGRDLCLSQLFDGGDGVWTQLLHDLRIDPEAIDFSADAVVAVASSGGRPLADIADEADSEAFVRACLHLAWQFSRDPATLVYYSIAGGRKTMGAALAFAAQAYGRPQDRIFHVLVSPEFESNRGFFFPPHSPREIELRDARGQPYRKSTRYAELNLVALPFFSFRDRLSSDLLDQPRDPATLLAGLTRELPADLLIDLAERKLVWKERQCDLRPAHLALYARFAELRKNAACAADCPGCAQCWPTQGELLAQQDPISRLYRRISPGKDPTEMSDSGIFSLTPDNFHSYRSKLNHVIAQAYGAIEAPCLQIGRSGKRPQTRYGLKPAKTKIRLLQ